MDNLLEFAFFEAGMGSPNTEIQAPSKTTGFDDERSLFEKGTLISEIVPKSHKEGDHNGY